ncbi:MAG: MerR family transcriptional regulator [Anaerolineaceae bacterium]|nr:MerR family transcriptional regulator [Anaerolineaceae bacterium]
MQINDVCQKCNITKKAIEYYEKKGLVHPKIAQNGYRTYDENDINQLKEISVLRKLGISTADIKLILMSENKSAVLSKCKLSMNLKLQKTIAQHKSIDHLINNYDIEQAMEYFQTNIEPLFTIKEKLLISFPGSYGMYMYIHFGQFLNEKIEQIDQKNAYLEIIKYLDNVSNLHFSIELEEYMESCLAELEKEPMQEMDSSLLDLVDNIDEYLETNKEKVEQYLKIRTSDEFKNSPAYKLHQLLLAFQQQSGYYEVFIHNLKILSPSYKTYTEKLEKANTRFFEEFPQAGYLYDS